METEADPATRGHDAFPHLVDEDGGTSAMPQRVDPEASSVPERQPRGVAFGDAVVVETASSPHPEPLGAAAGADGSAHVAAAPAGEAARPPAVSLLPPHTITLWRLPSSRGKMPAYVERRFRLKALGLAFVQVLVVLAIMVLIEISGFVEQWTAQMSGLLLLLMAVVIALLVALACCKEKYPVNYIILMLVTVVAGIVWGVGGQLLPAQMHFQIMGVIAGTMLFTIGLMLPLARMGWNGYKLVLGSMAIAWAIASIVDAIVAPMYDISETNVAISILVAFGLFTVFLWEVGQALVECNPDSFMSVVVAMNASLLVVISIPFIWAVGVGLLVSCCLTDQRNEAAERAEVV